jgi:hypothetical protein
MIAADRRGTAHARPAGTGNGRARVRCRSKHVIESRDLSIRQPSRRLAELKLEQANSETVSSAGGLRNVAGSPKSLSRKGSVTGWKGGPPIAQLTVNLMGRRYWFRRKRFGWGLEPGSRKGWIATAVFVAVDAGGVFVLMPFVLRTHPWALAQRHSNAQRPHS